jgi:4-cresol dehydrogenase (hydroxylating)
MTGAERERVPDKNLLGIPSLANFSGRTPESPVVADGHLDFAVVVPMSGEAVLEALKVLGRAFAEDGIGTRLGTVSSFHLRTFIIISAFPISRTNREANRRTRAAYERAVKLAAAHGWGQYRTHAAFMDLALSTYAFNDHALSRLHATLKDALDPKGILSPGRYGIWPRDLREARA